MYPQLDQRADVEACLIDDARDGSSAQLSPDTLNCEASATEGSQVDPASPQSMLSVQPPVFFGAQPGDQFRSGREIIGDLPYH